MAEAAVSRRGARSPARSGRSSGPRSQLIDLLESESGAVPVIFISAGPGWGKTTLLTQWAARSQRPFAWVSVDANDNDPIVLLTYVATALGRVSRLNPGVFEAPTSPGARRIAHRVGRRSLRHLVERRGPRLDLGMPEQAPRAIPPARRAGCAKRLTR